MIYVDGSVTRSGFVVKYVIIFKFFFDSSLLLWNKKWKNWHCCVLGRRCRKLFRDLFLILVGFVINPPPTRLKFQLHLHQHWITQEIPSHTHSIDPTHFYFPLTSFEKKNISMKKKLLSMFCNRHLSLFQRRRKSQNRTYSFFRLFIKSVSYTFVLCSIVLYFYKMCLCLSLFQVLCYYNIGKL